MSFFCGMYALVICCLLCLLKAASLPHDSAESFHFCYVSAADQRLRGVSSPFQFVSDRQNDWELLEPLTVEHEVVQPQQLVMVHT